MAGTAGLTESKSDQVELGAAEPHRDHPILHSQAGHSGGPNESFGGRHQAI
jgi:hypothetical protein